MQKYFSSLVFLTKILIIAGAYYVVSDRLLNDGNFNGILWLERIDSMGGSSLTIIILLFFFTLMNWSLEIFKWKTLVSSVAKISFTEAAKQSLASLTASLLTPNRIGEYGAKAIYFKKNYRPKILVLNFLGNAYQMFITLVFGLIGLSLIGDQFSLNSVSVSFLIGIMISFILFISLIVLLRKKWLDYLLKISNDLFKIPFQIHKKSTLYAIGRYLVFSHQFYLFLIFFGVDLDYSIAMPIIFSMYLFSSVIPGFVLFDWLVKGSVAVTLFHFFGVDEIVVLSITASMWILNFALPAIIGSFYVLTFNSRTLVYGERKLVK